MHAPTHTVLAAWVMYLARKAEVDLPLSQRRPRTCALVLGQYGCAIKGPLDVNA